MNWAIFFLGFGTGGYLTALAIYAGYKNTFDKIQEKLDQLKSNVGSLEIQEKPEFGDDGP